MALQINLDKTHFLQSLYREVTDVFRLTSNEEQVQRKFERLAYQTYEYFADNKVAEIISANFRSWVELPKQYTLSSELIHKFKEWEITYRSFMDRNPRVELFFMLQDMSETDQQGSWFGDSTIESRILDWVDTDGYESLPIDMDTLKVVTPQFYERLKFLRKKCGGWLFRTHVTNQTLFTDDQDIADVRWHRDSNGQYLFPRFWPKWT